MVTRYRKRIPLKSGKDLVIFKRGSHFWPRLSIENHREPTPRLRPGEETLLREPMSAPHHPDQTHHPEQESPLSARSNAASAATAPAHRTSSADGTRVRKKRRRRTLQGGLPPVRYPRLKAAAAVFAAVLLLVFVLNKLIGWAERPSESPPPAADG